MSIIVDWLLDVADLNTWDEFLFWILVISSLGCGILYLADALRHDWEAANSLKKHGVYKLVYKSETEQSKPTPPRAKDYSFALLRKKDIYLPDTNQYQRPEIAQISMTSAEAVAAGFSFRKLSGRIRITGYHGTESDVLIPSEIAGLPVREIRHEAFRGNRIIRQVEIPDSVVKLGASAFEGNRIRSCSMGNGITFIPSGAFRNCTALKTVILPEHLTGIGDWSFRMCYSLWYIAFPASFCQIGAYAFEHSAIEGFSIENPLRPLQGGSAFCATPLAARYKVLRADANKDSLYIMQCCVKSGIVAFPPEQVILGRNSMSRTFDLLLDFSRCAALYADPLALPSAEAGYRRIKVITPIKQIQPPAFPPYVKIYDKWDIQKNAVQSEENLLLDIVNVKISPVHTRGITARTKGIILQYSGDILYLRRHAICGQMLEAVTINKQFITSGELFSPDCAALHQVSWNERSRYITKYIPPADLVGETVHKILLHAFRSRTQPITHFRFFDSRIIDRLFQKECFADKSGTIPLNQKQRILIAIDVLRSTQRSCDSDTAMYRRYLETHQRYAKIICERIADKYPEYQKFLQKL